MTCGSRRNWISGSMRAAQTLDLGASSWHALSDLTVRASRSTRALTVGRRRTAEVSPIPPGTAEPGRWRVGLRAWEERVAKRNCDDGRQLRATQQRQIRALIHRPQ